MRVVVIAPVLALSWIWQFFLAANDDELTDAEEPAQQPEVEADDAAEAANDASAQ